MIDLGCRVQIHGDSGLESQRDDEKLQEVADRQIFNFSN